MEEKRTTGTQGNKEDRGKGARKRREVRRKDKEQERRARERGKDKGEKGIEEMRGERVTRGDVKEQKGSCEGEVDGRTDETRGGRRPGRIKQHEINSDTGGLTGDRRGGAEAGSGAEERKTREEKQQEEEQERRDRERLNVNE